MTLLVYAAACAALCTAFLRLGVLARARQELAGLAGALAVLGDPGLAEAEKEERTRAAALRALAGVAGLVLRLAAVAAVALAPVTVADAAGLVPAGDVWRLALRPEIILGTTLALLVLAAAGRRLQAVRRA